MLGGLEPRPQARPSPLPQHRDTLADIDPGVTLDVSPNGGSVVNTVRTARSIALHAALGALVVAGLAAAAPATAAAAKASPLQQAKLTAADGATYDHFGQSVAISGDTVAVGVQEDDIDGRSEQGSVYVFVRSGATWSFQAKLTAPGGSAGDRFGASVAIAGDTVVAGAPADDIGANSTQGSAWVFVRDGVVWAPPARLVAADGAANVAFGNSVAISGETIAVGEAGDAGGRGSAYVFTYNGRIWTQQAKLTASDGAALDNFGDSVAISGETVVVGAAGDDIGASVNQGSAYVFTRSGTTWSRQAKLTAGDGRSLGRAVALTGATAVVGSPETDHVRGVAYVFTRSGTTWSRQARLTASSPTPDDAFGISVAISGKTAVVGANGDTVGGIHQGAAYVFTRAGATWTRGARLFAADGASSDDFGISVGVSGGSAVAGAFQARVAGNYGQGAAYVFAGLVPPRISRLSPAHARPGATVTITGTGFGAQRGASKVYFGGKAADRYVDWSATRIKVKVPRVSKGKTSVLVKTLMGRSNAKAFWRD